MLVAVQSHHPHVAPGAAPARLAVGGGKQTESSRHALGELLAADRRGEFLAMVVHELRSPLSNILDGIALARDTEGLLPQSEWLWTGLEDATRRVHGLLADLMDLCQASHPTFRLHRRSMDLAAAVFAAADRRRSDFERLGLSLAIEVGAEAIWITADPERLELVLGNLLENAAKYTGPGGRVTVSVEAAAPRSFCGSATRAPGSRRGAAVGVRPLRAGGDSRGPPQAGLGNRPAAGADPGGIARRPRRGVQRRPRAGQRIRGPPPRGGSGLDVTKLTAE